MNQERIKKLFLSNIELAVSLTLLFAITSVNAFIFSYRLNEIAWLFIASLAAALLAKGWRGNPEKLNYLRNGDGMAAMLGIITAYGLFQADGPVIAAVFCLGALILLRTFLLLTDIAPFAGFFANITALAACAYLIHRFDISHSSLQIIVTGAFRTMISSYWPVLAALLLMTILYVPAIQLRHEIALFAMGRDFFEETGYRYRPALFILEGMRCILTAASVLGSGVFAAAGIIFISSKRKENAADYAAAAVRIALTVQILAMLQAVAGGAAASIAALCATILWPYIARRFSE